MNKELTFGDLRTIVRASGSQIRDIEASEEFSTGWNAFKVVESLLDNENDPNLYSIMEVRDFKAFRRLKNAFDKIPFTIDEELGEQI